MKRASSSSMTAFAVIVGLDNMARMPRFAQYLDEDWVTLNRLLLDGATDSPVRQLIRRLPPALADRLMDRLFVPGMMRHYLFRKRLLWQETQHAIEHGTRQVIVLGGGFDTLAWRVAKVHPQVRFFELDLPETQTCKLELLARAGAPPANCQYLPADLARTPLEQALSSAPGFDAASPTLVIIEGVLMYLSTQAVESLFSKLRECLTGPLTLVFGAMASSDDAGSWSLRLVNALLRRRQEATDWHLPGRELAAFLARLGYELEAWMPYRALQAQYVREDELAGIPDEDENYFRATKSTAPGGRVTPRAIDEVPFIPPSLGVNQPVSAA